MSQEARAKSSKGVRIQHATPGQEDWVTVPGARDIELPDPVVEFDDSTTQEDFYDTFEPIGGAVTNLTFEVNLDEQNELHGNSAAGPGLRYLQLNTVRRDWRAVDLNNNKELCRLTGFLESMSHPRPYKGLQRSSVSVKPTGGVTFPDLQAA